METWAEASKPPKQEPVELLDRVADAYVQSHPA
jgi:hypothetical protein